MEINDELVNYLIERGVLQTPAIIKAFRQIDRKDFVPSSRQADAYKDMPLPIGYDQTISQPTVVAFMIEQLQPTANDKALDVGSGSGYTSAILSLISKEVSAVEIVSELVEISKINCAKYNLTNLKIEHARKNKLGLPEEAPFDKILVSASARELPTELMEQLNKNGTAVIPVGTSIFKVEKNARGDTSSQEFPGFVFVPLRDST